MSAQPHHAAGRDHGPDLLHNSGYAPSASIVWRGLGRSAAADAPERLALAGSRGTWLQLTLSIGVADARHHREWNTAAPLLELVQPGHGLAQEPAQRRLIELIEEHTAKLDWPPCLIAGAPGFNPAGGNQLGLTLDHALSAFVAVSKSIGSLWLRKRPARLAPLHSPRLMESSGTSMRGVRWGQTLWFPEGIPSDILKQAAQQSQSRVYRPNPMG
jgi:hypothetical protein